MASRNATQAGDSKERELTLAVDSLIQEMSQSNASNGETKRKIELLCRRILSATGQNLVTKQTSFDLLFDPSLPRGARRFATITFLRLLAGNQTYFEELEFRIRVFKLFDDMLADDIYGAVGIKVGDQTHKKESALADVATQVDDRLSELVATVPELQSLGPFREKLMRVLNGPLVSALLKPFVARSLLSTDLDSVFRAIDSYLAAEGHETIAALDSARTALYTFRDSAASAGSHFSTTFVAALADRLVECLNKHFDSNPLSRPAYLQIHNTEKKYPLHELGREFNANLLVENTASGHANEATITILDQINIQAQRLELFLGLVEKGKILIMIPCQVTAADESALLCGTVRWTNFDQTEGVSHFELLLEAQRSDVPWQSLEEEEPYSLEPVTTKSELVGRREHLRQMLARGRAKSVGSFILYGQKRVGKTSVARTLETQLGDLESSDYLVIFLETGAYKHPDPSITIEQLGRRLCELIGAAHPQLATLPVPPFEGPLSPLDEFLSRVLQVRPATRVMFILDEFDELPLELFRRGGIGDSFFLTLRTLSGRAQFGFVLVGGENMEFVLRSQGDRLNKFQPVRLDYFDRQTHWSEFIELVRNPTIGWLEFSDASLSSLYNHTAGNPYFTKLICGALWESMVQQRDSHVTEREVEEAVREALRAVANNSFQHFWEDGVLDVPEATADVTLRRRKVLLSFATALKDGLEPTAIMLMNACEKQGMQPEVAQREIADFERREILVGEHDTYRCKVPFFEKWLRDQGLHQIAETYMDRETLDRFEQLHQGEHIQPEEIVGLIETWGTYRGRALTEDRVRAWLNQFEGPRRQRLMFKILTGINFYSQDRIRARLKDGHGIVRRGLTHRIDARKRKRKDILLSYLDAVGKSGAQYAKLYADENLIYYDNVMERGHLEHVLRTEKAIRALVFIDDFVGTGDAASLYLTELVDGNVLPRDREDLDLFFVAVTGLLEGQDKIETTIEELRLMMRVHLCEPLSDGARCFHKDSLMFPDPNERQEAMNVAWDYGTRLVKGAPLGYGNCQTTVVFDDTIPDNSLPILWQQSRDWTPLFPRS